MTEDDARSIVSWLLDSKLFCKTLADDKKDHGVVFRPKDSNTVNGYFIARYSDTDIVTVEHWSSYTRMADSMTDSFSVYSMLLTTSLEDLYISINRKRAKVKLETVSKRHWYCMVKKVDPTFNG